MTAPLRLIAKADDSSSQSLSLTHHTIQHPSKHAGSDLEVFWLWQLLPACSQHQARQYMSNPTSCIQFSSVLPKKAQLILYKTDLDPIRMAWLGFGQCIWSGSKNHWAQFWQNATSLLLVSCVKTCLQSSTDGPDHTVQNRSGSSLLLADCVRFGAKWIPSGSKRLCRNHRACF